VATLDFWELLRMNQIDGQSNYSDAVSFSCIHSIICEPEHPYCAQSGCSNYINTLDLLSRPKLMAWLVRELDKESDETLKTRPGTDQYGWYAGKRRAYKQVQGADMDGEFDL
jgi:hypothetical protein